MPIIYCNLATPDQQKLMDDDDWTHDRYLKMHVLI